MVSLTIGSPIFLWLLLLIPLLIAAHFYFLQRTQKKAMQFANFEAIKRIKGERFVTRNMTLLVLRVLVLLCFTIGLSQVTVYYEGARNDFDYIIAIDTSSSMLAEDLEPSRLGAAKVAAIDFIDTLTTETNVGYVEFSGVTYLREPLRTDPFEVKLAIQNANVSRTSGTDISGAIITGTNSFIGSEQGKAIIIFTDGVDTVGAYVDDNVRRATEYALSQQVVIHTVGLGTDDAPVGYLPQTFNLTSSIDRDTLIYIANETGGTFEFPTNTEELNNYFRVLDSQFTNAQLPVPVARYAFLLGVLLLAIEWIAFNFIFRRIA